MIEGSGIHDIVLIANARMRGFRSAQSYYGWNGRRVRIDIKKFMWGRAGNRYREKPSDCECHFVRPRSTIIDEIKVDHYGRGEGFMRAIPRHSNK